MWANSCLLMAVLSGMETITLLSHSTQKHDTVRVQAVFPQIWVRSKNEADFVEGRRITSAKLEGAMLEVAVERRGSRP
ncbi:hypothetical protein BJV78DRAFT_350381 [Lactifluus subvellereus]|nr:hypothetical protein BJV78DRAFT_350381 [Lactifluus subvellereus]